ncbi:MAG: PqqD family peptide modification chaperone [Gammaproteobacteria bacterium]
MSADGLRQTIGLEGDVARFLARFDGQHTLGELIRELSAEVEVEPARVRTECIRMARLLLERGFITASSGD